MKRTIGLDVDGVLADWTQAALDGIDSGLTIDDVDEFKLQRVLKRKCGPEVVKRFEAFVSRAEFTRHQKPLPWAHELVETARAFGEVTIITSPWRTPGWYDARVAWLKEQFGIDQDQILVGARKERTRYNVFVDDKPANCNKYADENPISCIFMPAWPYNTNDKMNPLVQRRTPEEIVAWLKEHTL